MNDFTKEELEGILEGLQIIDADPGIRPKIYWEDSLKDKIQSLIDNYCEHEKIEYVGDVHGYNCKRCDKSFTGADIDADRHMSIIEGEE